MRNIEAAYKSRWSLDTVQINELLSPFLAERELSPTQLNYISTYIDILMRWNERTNLTSIRDPQEIVRRHFGESLFAAIRLLEPDSTATVVDVGSGAGFPGLLLKIYSPQIRLTLIEAHSKKNTFLREVVRSLKLPAVDVHLGRAEQFTGKAEVVTLRAVEKFTEVLPVAANLVGDGGRLALMVGAAQVDTAKECLPGHWSEPAAIPNSASRVLLVRTHV